MNTFAKNFSTGPKYNNSSLRQAENTMIIGNTLSVCDQIFERLQEYYTSEEGKTKGYECFSIARLFYWALQDYARPSFSPHIISLAQISENGSIPDIDENQVIILCIPGIIAEYHYVVACKADPKNYKIYSSFGAHFIEPFYIPSEKYNQLYDKLIFGLSSENVHYQKKLNELPFVKIWNTLVGKDLKKYFENNYIKDMCIHKMDNIFEFANLETDLELHIIDNIRKKNILIVLHQLNILIETIEAEEVHTEEQQTEQTKKIKQIELTRELIESYQYINLELAFEKCNEINTLIKETDDVQTEEKLKIAWNAEIQKFNVPKFPVCILTRE